MFGYSFTYIFVTKYTLLQLLAVSGALTLLDNRVAYDNGPTNPPTTFSYGPKYLAVKLYNKSPIQVSKASYKYIIEIAKFCYSCQVNGPKLINDFLCKKQFVGITNKEILTSFFKL